MSTKRVATAIVLLSAVWVGTGRADGPADDVAALDFDKLQDVEVTTVSRKPEPQFEAADAVYVITRDEIIRAGVRTLADALRLAPGVQVGRVDASGWAIGVRGFANRLSRAVLVLIDGRSVYDPLFAGTYWEVQDYPLEDIERIEVIRGPGGTLWGANAFNGVINIITRSARDTQGGYLEAGGGKEERGFGAVRYGGAVGDGVYYRGYAKGFDRDAFANPRGPEYDAWRFGQAGFRTDWDASAHDRVVFHGDVYGGTAGERVPATIAQPPFQRVLLQDGDLSGGNVVGRWAHRVGPDSDFALQTYFDDFYRRDPHFLERRNTGDIDFQHRFRFHLLTWQEILWGTGYRISADRTAPQQDVLNARFVPADRALDLFSAFVQDELVVVPNRLRVTIGSKFEHNDLSGFEVQPSGRVAWTPDTRQVVWGAVARAVRTPSRLEHDVVGTASITPNVPVFIKAFGNDDFRSEKVIDYELGYRVRPASRLYLDVVSFYNQYHDLLSVEPAGATFTTSRPVPGSIVQPLVFGNGIHGESYGVEIAADASMTDWWRVDATYSYLNVRLHRDPDSLDTSQEATAGDAPHHIASVRSLMNLPGRFQLDLDGRYVDVLPNQHVDGYVELDARVARRFAHGVELSVVGDNLLHAQRREFGGGTEVQRAVFGMVRWWW